MSEEDKKIIEQAARILVYEKLITPEEQLCMLEILRKEAHHEN